MPQSVTMAYKNPPLMGLSNKHLSRLSAFEEREECMELQEEARCNPKPRQYLATKEEQEQVSSFKIAIRSNMISRVLQIVNFQLKSNSNQIVTLKLNCTRISNRSQIPNCIQISNIT